MILSISYKKPSHSRRAAIEATRISKLWYPRPKPREKVEDSPQLAERVFQLLTYGYAVGELEDWFRLKQYRNLRAGTNTAEANIIWDNIKTAYDSKCAYCGKRTAKLTKDHVVPISKGGKDNMGNIVPACFDCNRKKNAESLLDWPKFRRLQLHFLDFDRQ